LHSLQLKMKLQTTPDSEITPDQKTELEPLYRVLIHNDDVTSMDFVTHILVTIFFLSYPEAVEIMLSAHRTGLAVVQILPKAEAEKRINKAHFAAGLDGYPLHFSMEPE
jgi:ATP-dependent Clp protease adaptor protein ClpS